MKETKGSIISCVMLILVLISTFIIGGYTSEAKASDTAKLSKWAPMSVTITNDNGVSRQVSIVVTDILPDNQAKVTYTDKGKTYHVTALFVGENILEFTLDYAAKLVCEQRVNGDVAVSYAQAGGLKAANGIFHRKEVKNL